MKLVHSQVLQNIGIRVDLAFQSFFRRVKEGAAEVGFPRFKGFGRYDSITYPQYGNGVRLEGERLILSKVGAVHVVLHRPVEGTPKTVTLTRSCTGKWFACFSCETEADPLPPTGNVVGVDVGLSSFATLSDGRKIDNPRFYRRDEADLPTAHAPHPLRPPEDAPRTERCMADDRPEPCRPRDGLFVGIGRHTSYRLSAHAWLERCDHTHRWTRLQPCRPLDTEGCLWPRGCPRWAAHRRHTQRYHHTLGYRRFALEALCTHASASACRRFALGEVSPAPRFWQCPVGHRRRAAWYASDALRGHL